MKVTSETKHVGLMYGLVVLGPAVGKLKYMLLNEEDLVLFPNFKFMPHLEVDKNGSSVCVYALAYDPNSDHQFGIYVHHMIWENYNGSIAPDFEVVHKNGVTVDNRIENLILCKKQTQVRRPPKNFEDTLYWRALMQLPEEVETLYLKTYKIVFEPTIYDGLLKYYECHFAPCTKIEQQPEQFQICGACCVSRYCSLKCQKRDWLRHSRSCSRRFTLREGEEEFVER